MHGEPIAEAVRVRSGMTPEFVAKLRAYVPAPKGRAAVDPDPESA